MGGCQGLVMAYAQLVAMHALITAASTCELHTSPVTACLVLSVSLLLMLPGGASTCDQGSCKGSRGIRPACFL